MKNVLEKTGHKKAYYETRRLMKYAAASFALFLIAAIPVGISYRISLMNNETDISAKKEEKHVEEEDSSIQTYEEE